MDKIPRLAPYAGRRPRETRPFLFLFFTLAREVSRDATLAKEILGNDISNVTLGLPIFQPKFTEARHAHPGKTQKKPLHTYTMVNP